MSSKSVVLCTGSKSRRQRVVLSRSNFSMMQADLAGESPGLPALHPSHEDCNMIHTATFHRHVSTNLLKALASKQLAAAGYVLDTHKAIVVTLLRNLSERRSYQP